MNIKQLQQAWIDYHKTAFYEGLRFGQYIFNEHGYEVGNSYTIGYPSEAYNLLFEALTNSLDELI